MPKQPNTAPLPPAWQPCAAVCDRCRLSFQGVIRAGYPAVCFQCKRPMREVGRQRHVPVAA